MPRRRAADPTAAAISPELIWLVMTGHMTTSRAAARGDRDLARDWIGLMLELARQGVDEEDASAVCRLVTAGALESLHVDADGYDFTPWAVSGCAPTGEGFWRWQSEFLARHDTRRTR